MILDIAMIALMVAFYAVGHYHGWTDYAHTLRYGRKKMQDPTTLLILAFLAGLGLALKWIGVLA